MDSLQSNGCNIANSDRSEPRTIFSAFLLSFAYLVGGLLYIYFSGRLAIRFSESIDQLEFIERYKGYGFIVVSASGLFVLAGWLMRRIQQREREIAEYRNQMVKADQRAMDGLFASSIAHNIKNLLMGIDFAVDNLDPQMLPRPSEIQVLKKANTDLKKLADSLCSISGQLKSPEMETFDLVAFVNDTINFARFHKKLRDCTIELKIPEACSMKGFKTLFSQMLLNLLINAGDATANSGRILLKVADSGSEITFEIHDNGHGIPDELKNKIMQPLFTTKPDGCGLGLLSLEVCCQQHGGSYSIQKSELGGTAFVINFPVKSGA